MKRIVVSVFNDISTDQRVHKFCSTLQSEGFCIFLIGRKSKGSTSINRAYKTHRISLLFQKGFLCYAEYNIRLFLKLLFLKTDILLANDLDTLLPNFLIAKIYGKKLVYDSHELFTETPELLNRAFTKGFWKIIEKNTVPKVKNAITVSNSIANYYNQKYQTEFITIRNVPYTSPTIAGLLPFPTKNKKIIIYQGAINIGRGIELMIDTISYLDDCIFVIIGIGDIYTAIINKIKRQKLEKKVFLLGKLNPNELKKITPLADLGISLEENLGLSYHYALPNKLFDYIHAKVPVLISDLPEMKKIVTKNNIGIVATEKSPKKLAESINQLFNDKEKYQLFKKNLQSTVKKYNWEKESAKLKSMFRNLK